MSGLTRSFFSDLLNRPGPLWLVGIDLSEINRNEANLDGARLSEANLHHASLQRAELSGAGLSPADLTKAFVGEPNLVWAHLSGGNHRQGPIEPGLDAQWLLAGLRSTHAYPAKSPVPPAEMIMLDAYGIHLGPLYIHFYALILMTGILAAAWLASREAARRG